MFRPLLTSVPTQPKPMPLWKDVSYACGLIALPVVLIGLGWLFFSGLAALFSLANLGGF